MVCLHLFDTHGLSDLVRMIDAVAERCYCMLVGYQEQVTQI